MTRQPSSRRHRKAAVETPAPSGDSAAVPGFPGLSVRLCRPGSERCETLHPDRISDLLPEPGVLLWVDLRDPSASDLEMLGREFGFHRLALEDAAKQRQRPKVDEYPGYFFVVVYTPRSSAPDEPVQLAEVDLFVGRNYVVSLHRGEVPALREAMDRWDRTDPELRTHVGFLLHTILDAFIDAFFPVVDRLEDRLDDLEMSLFEGGRGADPQEMLAIKRSLFALRRAIYPMREVVNTFLRRDIAFFAPEVHPYFQDVYDHVLRLLDAIDVQRDLATGVLDAHLAVVSNRLNETMQRLTVLAVCVAILGSIFGAWGMNFDRVPLAHHPAGFWLVAGGTLVLVGVALLWARLRGFL